jgi:flagellin
MKAFTIGPGTSGSTNFELLGFRGIPVTPKNIGRLSFQVGPAPDQLISIDLSDFGKNGDVTNKITGDQYPTNLNTVENANVVMQAVNQSLDKVAQTRATMGAVMNRLQHVIDNVTNVVTTSEASRSQIEDADYATASTELSRTQIMQQAATAVLAQANTDQQTVLKLLQ